MCFARNGPILSSVWRSRRSLTFLGGSSNNLDGGVDEFRDHELIFWGRSTRGRHGEPGTLDDELPQLGDGDPLQRVTLKDAPEDGVQFGRERENGLEKVGVLEVSPEGGILG